MSDPGRRSIRKYRLGSEPGDNLAATTTPEERIGMMWQLACESWALARLPFPSYTRDEIPIRVIPLEEDGRD